MDKAISTKDEGFNKRSILEFLHKCFAVREITILIIVLFFGIIMTIASPFFLTKANFKVVVNSISTDMIVTCAVTIALISGNIDFSIGSIIGITGFFTGILLNNGVPIIPAILCGFVMGALLGLINGLIVTKLKIIPLVATMGTWMAYKGIGLMMINNSSLSNFPAEFKVIAQKWTILGLPISIVLMVVVVLLSIWLLKYVSFFRQSYFIGANCDSAKLAGIRVDKFIIIIYMIIGVMAAIAGILLISRFGSAPASLGQGTEFRIVTAVLIGGVSFSGGEGSIFGAFLGVLFMGLINNALAIFSIDANLQLIIVGSILIISVAVDEANRRRKMYA